MKIEDDYGIKDKDIEDEFTIPEQWKCRFYGYP